MTTAKPGKSAPKKATGDVEIRMLTDHDGWKCGGLAIVEAALAAEWVAGGLADAHPDAVAYAKATG